MALTGGFDWQPTGAKAVSISTELVGKNNDRADFDRHGTTYVNFKLEGFTYG